MRRSGIYLLSLFVILFIQCKEKPPVAEGPSLAESQKDFFSTPQDVTGLYGTLGTEARDQGISIARFKPESHHKGRYYEECPVSMDLEGGYPGLANLLLSMSRRTPLMIIGKTVLRGVEPAQPGHNVKASLSFSVFLPVPIRSSEHSGDPAAGVNAIRDVRNQRFAVVRSLNEVQSALPAEMWLSGIKISEGDIEVQGGSKQATAISTYVGRLEASGQLASVEVRDIRSPAPRSAGHGTTTFTLVCKLKASTMTDFTYAGKKDPFVHYPSSAH